MLKTWKKLQGTTQHYVEVDDDKVFVWETQGPAITEAGGSCTYKELIDGKYHRNIWQRYIG